MTQANLSACSESQKYLEDSYKNNSNRDHNKLNKTLKSFESFLNKKSLFDILSTSRINELAATPPAKTTKTTTKAFRSELSATLTSSLLTATTTTTSTLGHSRPAAKVTTLPSAKIAAAAEKKHTILQKQQQQLLCYNNNTINNNECNTSSATLTATTTTTASYANMAKQSPASSFTASASSCSSHITSVATYKAASLTVAATTELLRCNMAKIASNFLTAIISTTSSGCINSNYKKAQQYQQQQQEQQFISFNSRKPKRKVNVEPEQQQQQQDEHPSRRHRQCQRRRSSFDCFFVAAIFSWIFLMVLKLQIVSASSGLLSKSEPMFISRSETFKFVSGDTIVLPCEVANTEPYIVAWKRGIAILFAGSVKVSPDPRLRLVHGFNLQIRDAVPQDAGDYICQIATMEPREITHTVEILVPPRIHHISTGGHLQVKKGSSVRIECSASGNPTPNVTWSRKNNILPNGEEKLHSHILSIENVDRHKGGVYICTANNGVGQPASSQVVLHVLYPPEISVERPVVFSGEGHEAMLVCIVHGETQPEVIWFKDTMQLDTTERHIMETRGSRHTLIIRKVHPQDFGNYSCVAENQLGKSRKTLQLSGKPNVAVFNSPPISQYKDRYNISWTLDSHTPIEEYKLSYRRMLQGHEVDNSIDHASSSSSLSSSSSSNLQQPYGVGSNHNHRINVGVVYNSNIQYWDRNEWRNVVLPAIPLSHHYTQGLSYMIRGLDPDQQYEATVQARNRYGWSDLTHSFVFSTSSNDGLIDLTTFLNHGLSDNEMRDLSVTFYGSAADTLYMRFEILMGITLLLVTIQNICLG